MPDLWKARARAIRAREAVTGKRELAARRAFNRLARSMLRGGAPRGTLITAGNNSYGKCLLPGTADIAVPTNTSLSCLPDRNHVLQTAVGFVFTLLLDDHGIVYAVGNNSRGALGRGDNNDDDPDNLVPRPVPGLERIVQIAAGKDHCAAVTDSGQLLMWGDNGSGQCGTGVAGGNVLAATQCDAGALAGNVRVVFVACGMFHTVALTSDGGVIVFGDNYSGQLGTGNNDRQLIPKRLAALAGIVGCAAGSMFTHLVSAEGRVFAMGDNDFGQLGLGHTNHVITPHEIDAAHFDGQKVAAVACGFNHTMAITREGKLFSCGSGYNGSTGLGHTTHTNTPQPVVAPLANMRVMRIVAGMNRSFALTNDGRVFGFGNIIGVPAAGAQDIPLLQEGALAGTTVSALSTGCYASHVVFIAGAPPTAPGFDALRQTSWQRRRLLLLALLQRRRDQPAAAASVLPCAAALPPELWPDLLKYV